MCSIGSVDGQRSVLFLDLVVAFISNKVRYPLCSVFFSFFLFFFYFFFVVVVVFFFFKQKTAYEIRPRDWSSDVCSSDLRCWPASWVGPRGHSHRSWSSKATASR